MKNLKPYNNFLNESGGDWGSSDQHAMDQSMHKELGEPKEAPNLTDVMSAAESAVDFYWDEWDEYKTDRDGLIIKAGRNYYKKFFPDFFNNVIKMFATKA